MLLNYEICMICNTADKLQWCYYELIWYLLIIEMAYAGIIQFSLDYLRSCYCAMFVLWINPFQWFQYKVKHIYIHIYVCTVKPLIEDAPLWGLNLLITQMSLEQRRQALDLTTGFNRLAKDNCKTKRKTFKFWDLVQPMIEVYIYIYIYVYIYINMYIYIYIYI